MATPPPIKAPRVEVLAWKRFSGDSARRGSADIKIGVLEILRCPIVQQDGQHLWVAPPQVEYQRPGDAKKQYFNVVRWPREWGDAITKAVAEAVSDHPEGLTQRAQPSAALGREVQQRAGLGPQIGGRS